jgi:hypothetical protein
VNPQNKKQIIFAGALAALLVVVLVYQFLVKGGITPVPPKDAAAKTSASSSPAPAAPASAVPGASSPAQQPLELIQVDIDPDQLLQEVSVVPFDYQANRIDRDPMTPLIGIVRTDAELIKKPAKPGSLLYVLQKNVSGIIWDDTNPLAVVDNEVVGVGYTYPDGVQVFSIERDKVIFKVRDSQIPVPMKEL